jgi:hypothetical protein
MVGDDKREGNNDELGPDQPGGLGDSGTSEMITEEIVVISDPADDHATIIVEDTVVSTRVSPPDIPSTDDGGLAAAVDELAGPEVTLNDPNRVPEH